MNAGDSKALKKGSRVYWRANAGDSGHITETSWDAVTIAWDNGPRGNRTSWRYARCSSSANKAR
jgi:hypothetical protein